MTLKEYQELAMRTNDGKCTDRLVNACSDTAFDVGGIVMACLGLSGESGELIDMIKKAIFHQHPIAKTELKKEIGDILWYLAMMCESFHIDFEKVAQKNIDKLKERYPDGFSVEASQNRKEYKHD